MIKKVKVSLASIALLAISTFNSAAWAGEQPTDDKVYECGGEQMKLRELEDGRLALEGKDLTGHVSIHRPTGMYRGSVDGWGSQHKTPEEALDAACSWLLKRAQALSEEALRKQLHEFYENWK